MPPASSTSRKRQNFATGPYADVYVIGMEFAALFPKTQESAPQARHADAVRSTPNPNPPVSNRVFIKTPLVRVTSSSRLPRPYQRPPGPKAEEDLHEAHLEALRLRMTATPIALSQEAMRSVLDPRYRFGAPRQPSHGGGWQPGGGVPPSTLGTTSNAALGRCSIK
jgi:hypothetical protein